MLQVPMRYVGYGDIVGNIVVFDTKLRLIKERAFRKIAQWVSAYVSPWWVTIAGFLLGCLAAASIYLHYYIAALCIWILSRICDGLDGSVARYSNRQSNVGGYMDIFLDVIVYVLVPLAAATTGTHYFLLALLFASYYVNAVSWLALSVLLEKKGDDTTRVTSLPMPVGIMEGAETVLLYGLLCIMPQYLTQLLIIAAILTLLSALQRVVWVIRNRRAIN